MGGKYTKLEAVETLAGVLVKAMQRFKGSKEGFVVSLISILHFSNHRNAQYYYRRTLFHRELVFYTLSLDRSHSRRHLCILTVASVCISL